MPTNNEKRSGFLSKLTKTEDPRESILNEKSSFRVLESYKRGRTNIMFSLAGEGGKCIVVTSSNPEEGKTTTCINLAITFAQTGAKVLLADCDLRKPRVHRHMEIRREGGLSDLLCGFTDVEKAVKKSSYDNLYVITAGEIPPNPAELLSSDKMKQTLEEMKQKYDYIFLDSPPIMAVSDSTILSQLANGVICVVRQNFTERDVLETSLQNLEFAGAKVLGFVFNCTETATTSYGRYGKSYRYRRNSYKYKYGYAYGDSPSATDE